MILNRKLVGGVALAAMMTALGGTAAYAQETTATISGRVLNDTGAPVANATVTVTHVPSGTTVSTVTNGDGFYNARNLRVGGPYTVAAQAEGLQGKTVQVEQISAGAPTALDVELASNAGTVSEVVVTAASAGARVVVTGPRSAFNAQDIETLPSFNRDLKDLARLNPFVTLDPSNNNALIIAGNNNRVNTIYVDGVKQADDFGLNGNGYPSQRSPISLDAVKQFNVEVAPYDTQYGSFQGGVLNIVTKSGENQFHGSAYYEYDSNDYAGKTYQSADGARTFNVSPFKDKVYGFTLGGPIIKDRLFFFAGYEKGEFLKASDSYGPADGTAPNKVAGVTVAQLDQITNILKTVYNYDPLGYGLTLPPEEDKKYFAKIDANITDNHRVVLEYQKEENTNIFNGGTNSATSLSLLSEYYAKPETLEVYTGQLFSQWTDNFSTTLEYSSKEVSSVRAPLGGTSFANFVINLGTASVLLGPDISSQANVLDNKDKLFKFKAAYKLGDHVFSAGYEHEKLDVFNEFVQRANGSYTFNSSCGAGNAITNLQNRQACSLSYNNAVDNIATHGAASWNSIVDTFYVQDEFSVTPSLTVRAGFRGEWYSSDTVPTLNQRFVNEYHFANTSTYDGMYIVMPRVGFNWRPDSRTVLTGGVGLFSGGSPNVWLSNSFTNTGNLLGSVSCTPTSTVCSSALTNVNGFQVGTAALTANTNSANLGTGIANAVDPSFRPPSVWKASISAARYFDIPYMGDDWRVHGDFIYQKTKDGITWVDLYAQANPGLAAPDGRPTYLSSRINNTTTAAFYDLLLTNTHKGGGTTYAIGVGKKWRDGWADGLDFDLTYTHTDIKETNPGTSSVALSNYSQWAISDRNNAQLATSNYNIKFQTKLTAGYRHAFFGDYNTSVRFFIQRRAGLPFSYTFDSYLNSAGGSLSASGTAEQMFGETEDVAFRDTQLFYVPKTDSNGVVTATSDPIVRFNSTVDLTAFNAFLQRTGLIKYAGSIAPRNAFKSRDVTTADLRFEQELPAFFPGGSKLKVFADVINLGNLINKKYGVLEQTGFPYKYNVAQAINCQPVQYAALSAAVKSQCSAGAGNYYQYTNLSSALNPTVYNSSTWYVKFGVKYEF